MADLCGRVSRMNETNSQRLQRLHEELAFLYRHGVTDKGRTETYWVRIDQLEDVVRREELLRLRAEDADG